MHWAIITELMVLIMDMAESRVDDRIHGKADEHRTGNFDLSMFKLHGRSMRPVGHT
jgi:hypothetical protein